MKIKIYSKAAHSTWIFFPEFDLLMDCGEGCATQLGINTVASIRIIVISHEHADHIAGLYNLVRLRARHGENIPKLTIWFPPTEKMFKLIEFIGPHDNVNWIPYCETWNDDEKSVYTPKEIPVNRNLVIRPFLNDHCYGSHGFNLIDRRTRLKEEYKGLFQTEIRRLIEQQVVIKENWTKTLVTYTGDTPPIKDVSVFNNPETLITDCTYLDANDNNENYKHCTLDDAHEMFRMSAANKMIGIHVSARYNSDYISKMVIDQVLPSGVILQNPDTIGEYNL